MLFVSVMAVICAIFSNKLKKSPHFMHFYRPCMYIWCIFNQICHEITLQSGSDSFSLFHQRNLLI